MKNRPLPEKQENRKASKKQEKNRKTGSVGTLKHWMIRNDCKSNKIKRYFFCLVHPQQLENTNISSFDAAGDIVERKLCAQNLGVLLDSCLTMKDHISEVSKAFYHLRNI